MNWNMATMPPPTYRPPTQPQSRVPLGLQNSPHMYAIYGERPPIPQPVTRGGMPAYPGMMQPQTGMRSMQPGPRQPGQMMTGTARTPRMNQGMGMASVLLGRM